MSNVMRRQTHIEGCSCVACGNFVSRRLRSWWHAVFVPLLQQIAACAGWIRGHGSLPSQASPRVPPAAALFVCLLVRLRVALPLVTSVPSALGLRITVPSSGLAPAGCYRPSFRSWPSAARLREPLMSNVRRLTAQYALISILDNLCHLHAPWFVRCI